MEIWKSITWAPNYEVSTLGRVRSVDRMTFGKRPYLRKGQLLSPGVTKDGYLQVGFQIDGRRKSAYVHVLVAEVFITKPPGDVEVNHKDGIKSNCKVDNLEWLTHVQNVQHSIQALGKTRRGENSGKAKLTEVDVQRIRQLAAMGLTNKQIAEQFNVATCTVHFVKNRITWSHVA